MKLIVKFLLFLFFSLNACKEPPVYFDQTYFQSHRISLPFTNALDEVNARSATTLSGVYGFYFYAVENVPALFRLNPQNQLQYILLSDSLDVQPGDYVQVAGSPVDSTLVFRSYTTSVSVLDVAEVRIIKQSHKVLKKAQQDYLVQKKELKENAKQAGSKLVWPDTPEWQLFYDKERSKFIAYFSTADLMYAADVNMVYDDNHFNLVQVYAREWFKGE